MLEIQTVDFSMLKEHQKAEYSDGDIVLFNDVAEFSKGNAYLLQMVVMVFCTNGKADIKINGRSFHVEKNDMIICPPNSVVEDIMISPDMRSAAIALSYEAMRHTVHMDKGIWDLRMFVLKNPVIHLDPVGHNLGELYYNLLAVKLKQPNKLYYKQVMHSLFECLFYELASLIQPQIDEKPSGDSVTQGDLLCKRFMELLTKTEGRERSVAKMADQLCVTPKYLSTATKAASGKTALEWIHLYAIETIKRQLKFTDKTIKEIADDMRFPNLSFFGKFVRSHTGMSPTEFRRHSFMENETELNDNMQSQCNGKELTA